MHKASVRMLCNQNFGPGWIIAAMEQRSAGQRLRAGLDAALAHAGREAGKELEFDEREQLIIGAASDAADRAERLAALWAAETNPALLCKLGAELRLCEKAAVELAARVNIGEGKAKSERRQRAAGVRWNRARPTA